MGPLKVVFLLNTDRVIGAEGDTLILKDGRRVNLNRRGLLTFGSFRGMESISAPVILVEKSGIKPVNFYPEHRTHLTYGPFSDLWSLTLRVSGRFMRSSGIKDPKTLLSWLELEPLLSNTFFGLLLLLCFSYLRTNPFTAFGGIPAFKLLFMPSASFSVLREVFKTVRFRLERLENPKASLNTALSYILGYPSFLRVLSANLKVLSGHGLYQPDLPEAHRGLSPNARKLPEPR